jgi:hypothetical protein
MYKAWEEFYCRENQRSERAQDQASMSGMNAGNTAYLFMKLKLCFRGIAEKIDIF